MTNEQFIKSPIRYINDRKILPPTGYCWKLSDLTASDAGMTEDLTMDRMRRGQTIGLDLSWAFVSIEDAAEILQAFNTEYVTIVYLDAMKGSFESAEFYVSDRSVPMYNNHLGLWESISFSVTKRNAKIKPDSDPYGESGIETEGADVSDS